MRIYEIFLEINGEKEGATHTHTQRHTHVLAEIVHAQLLPLVCAVYIYVCMYVYIIC